MMQAIVPIETLKSFQTVIDVRSPGEFAEDHVPGAINCPVLNDEERARVGTLYKQESPFEARKLGAALVSRNIATHLEQQLHKYPKNWKPLVYCWRGGQRSGAMVTILRQVGWNAQQLEGGYKAYRRQVVEDLVRVPEQLRFIVITGATGSAKTRVLHAIREQGGQVLDLEGLACHKGSVLGRLPGQAQPPQKLFESALLAELGRFSPQQPVFIEAESRKIGHVHVPEPLIQRMHKSGCIAIDAPRQARVDFLLQDYNYMTLDLERLTDQLGALRPLRGHTAVNQWLELAQQQQWHSFVDSLLREHYDALYAASQDRNFQTHGAPIARLSCPQLSDADISRAAIVALTAAQQNQTVARVATH